MKNPPWREWVKKCLNSVLANTRLQLHSQKSWYALTLINHLLITLDFVLISVDN